jgi:hypothetical protein
MACAAAICESSQQFRNEPFHSTTQGEKIASLRSLLCREANAILEEIVRAKKNSFNLYRLLFPAE